MNEIIQVKKTFLNPIRIKLLEAGKTKSKYKFRATVLVWDKELNKEWSIVSRNGARYNRRKSVEVFKNAIETNNGIPIMYNHIIEGSEVEQLGLADKFTDTDEGLIIEGTLNANKARVVEEIVPGFLNNVSLQVDAMKEEVDEEGEEVTWASPTDLYEVSFVNVNGLKGANMTDIALAEAVRGNKKEAVHGNINEAWELGRIITYGLSRQRVGELEKYLDKYDLTYKNDKLTGSNSDLMKFIAEFQKKDKKMFDYYVKTYGDRLKHLNIEALASTNAVAFEVPGEEVRRTNKSDTDIEDSIEITDYEADRSSEEDKVLGYEESLKEIDQTAPHIADDITDEEVQEMWNEACGMKEKYITGGMLMKGAKVSAMNYKHENFVGIIIDRGRKKRLIKYVSGEEKKFFEDWTYSNDILYAVKHGNKVSLIVATFVHDVLEESFGMKEGAIKYSKAKVGDDIYDNWYGRKLTIVSKNSNEMKLKTEQGKILIVKKAMFDEMEYGKYTGQQTQKKPNARESAGMKESLGDYKVKLFLDKENDDRKAKQLIANKGNIDATVGNMNGKSYVRIYDDKSIKPMIDLLKKNNIKFSKESVGLKEALSSSELKELSQLIELQEVSEIFNTKDSMLRNKLESKASEQQLRKITKGLKLNYDSIYESATIEQDVSDSGDVEDSEIELSESLKEWSDKEEDDEMKRKLIDAGIDKKKLRNISSDSLFTLFHIMKRQGKVKESLNEWSDKKDDISNELYKKEYSKLNSNEKQKVDRELRDRRTNTHYMNKHNKRKEDVTTSTGDGAVGVALRGREEETIDEEDMVEMEKQWNDTINKVKN